MADTVGLFVTCLADVLRPQVGVAALKLLRAAGARVVYPRAQTCCGQIAYNSGYRQDARRLAQKCAREFAGCDYVVAPSGSCCGMLRTHAPRLFAGGADAGAGADANANAGADAGAGAEVAAFAAKCLELSEYLEMAGFAPAGRSSLTVTYHDSCAGLRELGVKEAPRRLLRACGVTITEMPDCEECCGFGGRFAAQFGDLSAAMAERKCANIRSVKADAIVAGDLGCLLHIAGRLLRRGEGPAVQHWAEVVAAAA